MEELRFRIKIPPIPRKSYEKLLHMTYRKSYQPYSMIAFPVGLDDPADPYEPDLNDMLFIHQISGK